MVLNRDMARCTGKTQDGVNCHMKQNCKRYLSYTLDDECYVSVITAPSCIEYTPLECPLKIVANEGGNNNE
jgi:hypothetical protein